MSKDLQNLYGLVTPAEAAKVISFALPVFGTLFLTGQFNVLTAVQALIGIVGTLAVFQASKNVYVKTAVAAGTAALQALAVILTPAMGLGDVTRADWWTVIGAAFGAIGVLVVPNKVIPVPGEAATPVTVNVLPNNTGSTPSA